MSRLCVRIKVFFFSGCLHHPHIHPQRTHSRKRVPTPTSGKIGSAESRNSFRNFGANEKMPIFLNGFSFWPVSGQAPTWGCPSLFKNWSAVRFYFYSWPKRGFSAIGHQLLLFGIPLRIAQTALRNFALLRVPNSVNFLSSFFLCLFESFCHAFEQDQEAGANKNAPMN